MNKTNKRAILVALESTYNASGDTPTELHCVQSVELTPLAGTDLERQCVRPYYGNSPKVAGEQYAQLKISYELSPAGTAGDAPVYGALLKACGMSEVKTASTSCVYSPVSENEDSVVIFVHMDKNLHKLRGCRGTFSIKADADTIPSIEFDMMCLIEPAAQTALPSTAPVVATPALPISTLNTKKLSVHGVSTTWSGFSFDASVNAVHRKVVGNNDNVITDRKPSGTLNIEDPGVGVKDYFELAKSTTLDVVKFAHGKTAGSIIELNMPKCSLGSPNYSDVDGIQHLEIAYTPTPSTGNDELVLTFK